MVTVQVKYLGKSKTGFAVRPKGVEYKWKPGMTHLEMDEDHARVLVAERPDLWEVEGKAMAVEATPETFVGEPMSVDEVLHIAGEGSKARRRKDESG